MGLMKQFLDRTIAKAHDHRAAIEATLPRNDRVIGLIFATHAALGGADGSRASASSNDARTSRAVKDTMLAHALRMHVGGLHGSLARALPTELVNPALVITTHSFAIWDFGPNGVDLPGVRAFEVPRSDLASINRTGRLGNRRRTEVRIAFADESWADYLVIDRERNAGFFLAATGLG